jgi:hypothetical protein
MMPKKEKAPREYRGINDEIREQTKKFKDMSLKEKWEYFWEYYKINVIVIVIISVFVISMIHNFVTAKDYCFNGMLLNASMMDQEKIAEAFAEYAGFDTEEYECYIDASSTLSYQNPSEYELATSQRIVALIQSKELDGLVFDAEVFYNYAFNQVFMDLREVYTAEELAAFEGRIYYIDKAEIRRAEESESLSGEKYSLEDLSPDEIIAEAQTHRDPSTMEDPIPVGIFVDDSPFAEKSKAYLGVVPIYGISTTSQRVEVSKQFLEFLFDETIDFANMYREF